MKIILVFALNIILTGCQLYGGASIHDRSMDSEYKEDGTITTFGASQEFIIIKDINAELFVQHNSMPFVREKNGYGVNEIGGKIKMRFY